MSLDAKVWEELEACGLTAAHLDLLLGLLRLGKNGSIAWHFVRGRVIQNDIHLVSPSRAYDLQRVSEVVLRAPEQEDV